jgi:quinol monooxygenase YgiN
MFNVFVTMVPQDDKVAEFEKTLGELLDIVRQEPGCAEISWGKVVGKQKYAIVERYLDEEARNTHLATDAMKEYGPLIGKLSAEAPSVISFTDI